MAAHSETDDLIMIKPKSTFQNATQEAGVLALLGRLNSDLMMKNFWLINLVLFQLTWFCAAFYTAWAAVVIPLLIVLHFVLSPSPLRDIKVLALLPVGVLIDKMLFELGVFDAGAGIFPLWLLLLWVMFLLSLNHSLAWLQRCSIFTLSLIGAIGGSGSYFGGVQAGALTALMPISHMLVILMVTWALLLPMLLKLRSLALNLKLSVSRGKASAE